MTSKLPASANRSAVMLLAIMWGAYFLNYCDRQAISAMFPVLKSELGLTDEQKGLTVSIFLWVYGVGCPLAGQLADIYSKRMLVVFSLAIWSLVTVATGWSTSVLMLLVFRAAMGISESLYMPAAIALTANAFSPELRSRAVATLTTAQVAGLVGGASFGGWMAQHGYWREAFYCLGAIGVIYAVPYYIFLRGVNEESQVETKKVKSRLSFLELVRVPTFGLLSIVFPAFLFGLWMLYAWLPNFLHEKFELDLGQAGFTATVYLQSATLVGLLWGGLLADRLFLFTKASRLWLMAASLLLCSPCLHFIGNSSTLLGTCIAAALFGLFSGFLMGNIFPAAFEVVPADTRASAVGCLNFCGALVSGFAPLVVGVWKKELGIERLLTYTSILYIATALVLIAGIKLLFVRDYQRVHS